MAKRKRLTPANPAVFGSDVEPAPFRAPPIAGVAREAASTAAVEELAHTLTEARAQGRMVVQVSLDRIALDHLVRDRVAVDEGEMDALKASIRARGQQTPVELVDLGDNRYGLISGWRRVMALTALFEETGEDRFGMALALLRQPDDVAEAYQAMVEENEIRANLSHFERARIVAKAVEQGVFDSERTALQTLFERASRARRSKIGSFLPVVAELDGVLRFPQALSERLGLTLSRGFESDESLAARLRGALSKATCDSAEAEQALIEATLVAQPGQRPAPEANPQTPAVPRDGSLRNTPARTVQVATGIALSEDSRGRLVLEGNRVDTALKQRLIDWLRAGR